MEQEAEMHDGDDLFFSFSLSGLPAYETMTFKVEKTLSQTHPEVSLLGDSKSYQLASKVDHHKGLLC